MSAAVITRCLADEAPYLNAFVIHYLSLNFEVIYIISTDDSCDFILESIDSAYHSAIRILTYSSRTKDWQEKLFDWVRPKIEEEWILNVDIDEFLYLSVNCIIIYLAELDNSIDKIHLPWVLCISERYSHSSMNELNEYPLHKSSQSKYLVRNKSALRLCVHDACISDESRTFTETILPRHNFIIHYANRGFLDLISRIVGRNYENIKTGSNQTALLKQMFEYSKRPVNVANYPFRFQQYRIIRSLPQHAIRLGHSPKNINDIINNDLLRNILLRKLERLSIQKPLPGANEIEEYIEQRLCLKAILLGDHVPKAFGDVYIRGGLSLTNTTIQYINSLDT